MDAVIDDAVGPVTAATVLSLFPARPRLLALGEPTHGQEALLELRNDLFRELVEGHGYRTIALESDCLRGPLVDDYIAGGPGSIDDVMAAGTSHDWGAFAGNRELVRWMREFNAGRTPTDRLRFAGFDGPVEITAAESPRSPLTALHGYLTAHVAADRLPCSSEELDALLRDDQLWTNPDAMYDAAQSVGRSPEAQALRVIADDLVALLDAELPHLRTSSTVDELDRVRLHARTAIGLMRYHAAMAEPSSSRMARMLAARDSMMAANLLALAERSPTLVHAHNAHLQRPKSSMQMWGDLRPEWWSAGAIAGTRLGDDYRFLAGALGTIEQQGVDAPSTDTLEGMLYELAIEPCVVDTRWLAESLADTLARRESPWFGYAPFDPDHLDSVDGMVFVDDCQAPATALDN